MNVNNSKKQMFKIEILIFERICRLCNSILHSKRLLQICLKIETGKQNLLEKKRNS